MQIHLPTGSLEIGVYLGAAVVLLFLGYRTGRLLGALAASRKISAKEQELFTTQRSFKTLYEQEIATAKTTIKDLTAQVESMKSKVEEYRKKAAGFGGLFNSGGKKADAMYALLMENEALEEALYSQNEKLRQERTDALKDQMRATGYRRVLMSQLMSDERIKEYVAEVLNDEKRLPVAMRSDNTKALPPVNNERHEGVIEDSK